MIEEREVSVEIMLSGKNFSATADIGLVNDLGRTVARVADIGFYLYDDNGREVKTRDETTDPSELGDGEIILPDAECNRIVDRLIDEYKAGRGRPSLR